VEIHIYYIAIFNKPFFPEKDDKSPIRARNKRAVEVFWVEGNAQ